MASKMASPVPEDNTNQLKITDLAEVLQLLRRHGYSGTSYYDLGLYLGLSPATLDVITKNNKDDVESCLRECLTKWLQKADDVEEKGGPTIYSLISALRELGQKAVAEGIEMEKHPACKIIARHTSNQSLVTSLPQLVTLLHSEMLINETVYIKKEEDMLLNEILKAVCIDSNKLEVFARILIQYTATKEIGNTIMREYRKLYGCDESKDDNAKQDEIYLPPSLTSKFKSMRMKLSFAFGKIELIIKEGPPSTLDKIKNALMYYSEDLKPQVAQCDNIHDILELVRKDCSLDDIELLKAIVNGLDIEEAKVAIQEYSEALEKFSETELSECLNEKFSYASPLQCERITIVVDQKTDNCTLDDVRRLAANTFHKLSPQNSRRIKLNVIRDENSFTITFSFPLILSEQLITAALNNIDVLKKNKVKRLTIGYCTVYEVNDTSTPTATEIDEYTSSLSTSSSLSKQLMLSLGIQLINSTEKVNTLNEENMTITIEAESLKETVDTKNKKLSAYRAESDKFKKIAAEASQLLQEQVSRLTERDEENKELKEMKELLEEQLALFKSEKDAENKQLQLLQEKVKKMNLQIIEKDKQMQEMSKAKNSRDKGSQQDKILIFEDDTYGGSIIIDHPLIIKIVQTRQFQRLRDIKILGYTYQIIPKAMHSRLQHSIGMYYLAGEYVKQLQKRRPDLDITDSDVLCVQIAALCFNLGHGPFSHTFELFLEEFDRRWRNVSEASVEMFEYMLEDNKDLMASFEEYNLMKDIAFIKELILGVGYEQRKDKRFLYEIVYNKKSGLDVSIIDSTVRDAAVLGMNVTFRWKVFLSKVRVLKCNDKELHICFQEDDLATYNDLFRTRHSLFRELYFARKNRIVALMIKRILVKSSEIPLARVKDRRVSMSDATRSMFTYSQFNDSVLNTIKLLVDDPEVQVLLNCLESMKFIGQIGFYTPTYEWDKNKTKKHIVESVTGNIADNLIFDPIKTGYENHESHRQFFYTSDGETGQWNQEWALPPPDAKKSPLRIFLVSGDKDLIHEVQQVLQKLITDENFTGAIYSDEDNVDLMPPLEQNVLAQV